MLYGYGILNNHVPTLKATVMGGGVAWDADALAFIASASITDATQKIAVNKLVTDLKSASIWTKMKAIYPMVGGTASTHKWNLKDPRDLDVAFRLVFNGGWTHSATGAKGNGTTAYADTKYTGLTNNSCLAYYNRYTPSDYTQALMGVYNNPGVDTVLASNFTGNSIFKIRGAGISYSNTGNSGMFTANRTSQTLLNSWKNGVKTGTQTSAAVADSNPQSYSIFLNAYNTGFADFYSKSECAFACVSNGLTDTEASNLYTAVQAYETTLGRQI